MAIGLTHTAGTVTGSLEANFCGVSPEAAEASGGSRLRGFHRRGAGRRRGGKGSRFSALQNRLDLSVGIALGSASQIALLSRRCLSCSATPRSDADGPAFLAGAVVMIFILPLPASLVTNSGRWRGSSG